MATHATRKDIDLWVWADAENAGRLLKTVQDFGFGTLGLQQEDLSDPENVIQFFAEIHSKWPKN